MHKTIDAYNREMRLIPIILDMESKGVRIDPKCLDIRDYWQQVFDNGEMILRRAVPGAEPGTKMWFTLARANGYIDESKIVYTEKGNPRYGKEFLPQIMLDDKLKNVLLKRSALMKALSTYIKPYCESYAIDGHFHPYYNQTRNEEDRGTRTGRFSSNLQQLTRSPGEGLPNVRALIFPDENEVLIKRDFNGQELRVAAHYAEGPVLEAYKNDPSTDIHIFTRDLIQQITGIFIAERSVVKGISFLILYGGGAPKLTEKFGVPIELAREFFSAYHRAIPEFRKLSRDIETLLKSGKRVRTWGGRLYDVEPSKYVDGKYRTYYYKMINVLIQGSSADMTKEAMIRYYYHPDRKGRLILSVHDELVCSVHPNYMKEEMSLLKWAMDDIPGWDVPLCSEGKWGYNFGEMTAYED